LVLNSYDDLVQTIPFNDIRFNVGESGINGQTYYNINITMPDGINYIVIEEPDGVFISDKLKCSSNTIENLVIIEYSSGGNRVFLGGNTEYFKMQFIGDMAELPSQNEITSYEADNAELIITSSKPVSLVTYRLNSVSRLKFDALNIIRGFEDILINGQAVTIKTITQQPINGTNLINIVLNCELRNDNKFIEI
jgi:hypothetical protein